MTGNDLSEATVKEKHASHPVPKQHLINKINYANFQDTVLTARFLQKQFNRNIILKVKPSPYLNGRVYLTLLSDDAENVTFEQLRFLALYIPDNDRTLYVQAEDFKIEENGFSVLLSDSVDYLAVRSHKRYSCRGCTALFLQNGVLFKGSIAEFSTKTFVLHLNAEFPYTFSWLNSDSTATVTVQKGKQLLFSGECRILRWEGNEQSRQYIVEPCNTDINRFKPKQYRSDRHRPDLPVFTSFDHPLTEQTIELSLFDLSGSGFSVREKKGSESLFPGLVIPSLHITLPGGLKLTCSAQVISKREFHDEKEGTEIIHGCSILDMDSDHLTKLLAFIHQEDDSTSFINSSIDLNELWNFFFESGFIYPEKYTFFLKRKDEIKTTFEKLYLNNPSIGKHFINKKDGAIQAHMGMIRSYENSWLIHHHAAGIHGNGYAGLKVLNQVGSFTNSCHRIPSMHMHYLMCYFRPDNKFPVKVFQGIAEKIDDPKSCSIDSFAYFFPKPHFGEAQLDNGWEIVEASRSDLLDFMAYYDQVSDGLLPRALHILPGSMGQQTLLDDYKKAELKRDIKLFSLRHRGIMKALFLADFSDTGLNMSELMNCLKVFITDSDAVSPELLEKALIHLLKFWDEDVPFMLFPSSYMTEKRLSFEKTYVLWILDMEASDKYFTHLHEIFRTIKH
jgi:hypothetical protein